MNVIKLTKELYRAYSEYGIEIRVLLPGDVFTLAFVIARKGLQTQYCNKEKTEMIKTTWMTRSACIVREDE